MVKSKSLKQKAAAGMVWTAFQKYSNSIVSFISSIILARLLTPYDYGCIGMLSIFMVLAEVFIDGGFGSALIQKKRPTQVDYSTVFFWNIGMAVLMYIILFFSAPAIARFYRIPLLSDVLRVQGVILFIYAFNIVQRNQLKKKLNFKLLSIISITTSIIALTITIVMAYMGFGVWSLVAQHIVAAAIPSLVFWFYVKWRPAFTFSWASFKELWGFGFYMFLTQLTSRFTNRIAGLIIGRVYNPTTLGYYSKGSHTEKLASSSIAQIMNQVTYPLYAEAQDNKMLMQNMIKRMTMTISYITFPLMLILCLCAKPLFILLFSERWLISVPYFQVLCIAGLAYCLQSANLQTIAAIGKSKVMFIWSLVKQVVVIILMVGGLYLFGMKGLLAGRVIGSYFVLLVNMSLVSKYIGYKLFKQIKDLLPVGIVSVIAFLVSYGCGYLLNLGLYLDGIVKFLVFLLIYLAWSFLFKPEAYTFFASVIPVNKIKNKINRKKESN